MTDFDRAFISDQAVSGGYKEAQPDVATKIRHLTKKKKEAFWIGKTSGGEQGCTLTLFPIVAEPCTSRYSC